MSPPRRRAPGAARQHEEQRRRRQGATRVPLPRRDRAPARYRSPSPPARHEAHRHGAPAPSRRRALGADRAREHADPRRAAPNDPIIASGMCVVATDERRGDPSSRPSPSAAAVLAAPARAQDVERRRRAAPKLPNRDAESARTELQLVARDHGQQRVPELARRPNDEIAQRWRASAKEWPHDRTPLAMPVSSDSGTPGSVCACGDQDRTTRIMPRRGSRSRGCAAGTDPR